ncbi:GPI-anchored cupredoxin-like protein 1 [Apiospora phragmitis]|uniref:GPI-anchored cupredoxin-like protein 1 n=1 Tax=Apiospora phragmitis TaxID=2905665 RepID=A0ABR1WV26_9PEZI
MKFSAALSLALAPLALAKAVNNVYPARRMEHKGAAKGAAGGALAGGALGAAAGAGGAAVINAGSVTQIILVWANPGGGAATTTMNEQVTVTQTVTAGAPPGASAPPAAAATHSVIVGGAAGLVYTPAEVKAKKGDMVIFTFMSANHTATQSTFDKPCDAMPGGMDSGFQPNANNTVNPPPQVAMQVMVETPLWFYCRQSGHCGKGMTFSINPTAEKSQAIFQSMAIAQKGMGAPSAIVGGGAANGTAPPPPPAGGAAAPPPPAKEGGAAPPATGGAAAGGMTQGVGQLAPGSGQCICAVSCAPGSFPAVAAQGLGAFGGMPGGMPAEMAEA